MSEEPTNGANGTTASTGRKSASPAKSRTRTSASKKAPVRTRSTRSASRPVAATGGAGDTATAGPTNGASGRPTPGPTYAEIAMRAYFLYLERGRVAGSAIDDWLRAEHELLQG